MQATIIQNLKQAKSIGAEGQFKLENRDLVKNLNIDRSRHFGGSHKGRIAEKQRSQAIPQSSRNASNILVRLAKSKFQFSVNLQKICARSGFISWEGQNLL